MSFEQKLKFGKVAEGLIAKWLLSRGHSVMPVYEIEQGHGKGPQLFTQNASHAAPDLVAFTSNGVMWIEAKHKTVFSWHRNSKSWVTGIDLRHYEDYQQVSRSTNLPVWLLFFHRSSEPSDVDKQYCPEECPVGLFGGNLDRLTNTENHRSPPLNGSEGIKGHGKSGMVYWRSNTLTRLATLSDMLDLDHGIAA